jgi:hypothetical protein
MGREISRRQLLVGALGLAATLPYVPSAFAAASDEGGSEFDVKRFGAAGNGIANDTAAVQRAVDAATASGGGTVYFPLGSYRLVKREDAIFAVGCHGDNITFRGVGAGSRIVTDSLQGSAFSISGAGKPEGSTNWWPHVYHNLPQHTILPARRGDATVRLANAGDARFFAPGDLVYLRTGQILDVHPGYTEPDSEINEVTSVVGDTLGLRWPLAKDYAQEYYLSGTTGRTSRTPGPNAAPLAITNAKDVTSRNVAFRDLAFDVKGDSGAISGGQIVGLTLENLTGTYRSVFQSMGDYRSARVRGLKLTGRGSGVDYAYVPVSTAKGTTDVLFENNTLSAEGLCLIHLHEGSAKVTFQKNAVISAPNLTANHAISIRGRAYGITIAENTISNGAVNGYAIIVDGSADGGGTIRRNTIRGEFVNAIQVEAPGWDVSENDVAP